MRKKDVVAYFGSVIAVADALHISRSAVYQWPDEVPYLSALHVERATQGKLKAGPLPKLGEAERQAMAQARAQ